MCSNPQFIVQEANRFDLDQGQLGNCWFISAVSMITQNATIFERVCPLDQTYDKQYYAGIILRFFVDINMIGLFNRNLSLSILAIRKMGRCGHR